MAWTPSRPLETYVCRVISLLTACVAAFRAVHRRQGDKKRS